jgi:gliding motility-associated-like protein
VHSSSQILYRASDLLNAGFTAGVFNLIGINVPTKATVFPFQFLSVKMGCTNKSALTAGTWEPTTVVYTNDVYSTVAGWNDFVLQSRFDWDGVSNIIVEICWDGPDGFVSSGGDPVMAAAVNYNCFQTLTTAAGVGCNLAASAASMYQLIPSFRARICSAPTVPITYVWQPTNGLNPSNTGNPYASPTQQTTYTLTAYFGGKCPKTDTITVTPKTFPYTAPVDTAIICIGDSTQLSLSGGTTNVWTPTTGLSCTSCTSTVASPTTDQLYVVTTTDTATGCVLKDSVNVFVLNLVANAWYADTLVDQGTQIDIGANITGGSSALLNYVWSPADYLNNANTQNPQSTPLSNVLYVLTVSAGGCSDTTQVNVRVNIIESPATMPNAFTPNGDGKNDGFYPVMLPNSLAKVKAFSVYNRYGVLVHNGNSPWDGRFNNADQPAGTYLYYITIERPLKEDEQFQGSVTLLR